MISRWPILSQGMIGPSLDIHIEHVLAEFNGPQIVLAAGPEGYYLGIAADEDEQRVRWMFAPVTPLELSALGAGVQSTRDAFLKPRVLILDYTHDDLIEHGWEVDGSEIAEANLPDAAAVLPAGSREILRALYPALGSREIALEQLGRDLAGIPFKALSQTINVFQRLWNALAAADSMGLRGRYLAGLEQSAMLSFAGATSGSLRINVVPADEVLFVQAAETFAELVKAGDDPREISAVLQQTGPRVHARYQELLGTLERNQLQLFARSTQASTFIGPEKALRILGALPQATNLETVIENAVGYFLTYSSTDLKFEFCEEDTGRRFKGDVHQEFRSLNRVVVVGEDVLYTVVVEVSKAHHPTKTTIEQHRLRYAIPVTGLTDVPGFEGPVPHP